MSQPSQPKPTKSYEVLHGFRHPNTSVWHKGKEIIPLTDGVAQSLMMGSAPKVKLAAKIEVAKKES